MKSPTLAPTIQNARARINSTITVTCITPTSSMPNPWWSNTKVVISSSSIFFFPLILNICHRAVTHPLSTQQRSPPASRVSLDGLQTLFQQTDHSFQTHLQ